MSVATPTISSDYEVQLGTHAYKLLYTERAVLDRYIAKLL